MNNDAGTPTPRGAFINGSMRKVSRSGVIKFLQKKMIPNDKHWEIVLAYLQVPPETVYDKELFTDYCVVIQKDFNRFFRFVYRRRASYVFPQKNITADKEEAIGKRVLEAFIAGVKEGRTEY